MDPGDRTPTARPPARQLPEAPSARYARRPAAQPAGGEAGSGSGPEPSGSLRGPSIRASAAALIGAAALVVVGGVLASTFGLLLIAGGMGTVIGLLMARAAVPADDAAPTPRRTIVRGAVGLALLAVVLADTGLWLFALGEGGVLRPFDYLWTTYGPFVPAVALVAALTAWWGANAGPVQR